MEKVKIDLACGDNKTEGYIGVDIADIPGVDIVHDLSVFPWPFENDSVDEVVCNQYIEHIPHDDILGDIKDVLKECTSFDEFKEKALEKTKSKDGFIKFLEELYRILKPGGKAVLKAPYATNVRAYGDPTHTRYIHDWSFYYANKEWRDVNKLTHYNINADFDVAYSYFIDEELSLKSTEVRQEAFKRDWNSIIELIVELEKRK